MQLSAKILDNVASVNQWEYVEAAFFQQGQTNTMYIQLVDLSKKPDGVNPIRYVPQGTTISLEATFFSLDSALQFTLNGINPFPEDKSIWQFNFSVTELPKSGSFQIKLVEDGVEKYAIVPLSITTSLLDQGGS